MKKLSTFILAIALVLLTACAIPVSETATQITSTQTTWDWKVWLDEDSDYWLIDHSWPVRGTHPEDIDMGDFVANRFRPIYYQLNTYIARLVDDGITFREFERLRTAEEYHNVCIAVSFIQYFKISREDFERAAEEQRKFDESQLPWTSNLGSGSEYYPIDLIYTFDSERINEFFRWENSIYAHEVGLPNPLRGEWNDEGRWVDYPNWTENPSWREHPFWEYFPFSE